MFRCEAYRPPLPTCGRRLAVPSRTALRRGRRRHRARGNRATGLPRRAGETGQPARAEPAKPILISAVGTAAAPVPEGASPLRRGKPSAGNIPPSQS